MTPTDALYRLWAKTNDSERRKVKKRGQRMPDWSRHPLPCHLIDVGHVAAVWLRVDPHLLNRFCALWPGVPREAVRQALVLIAAVHDLAKVHFRFQVKSERGWEAGYGMAGYSPPLQTTGYDHGRGVAEFFASFEENGVPDGVEPAWLSLGPLIHAAAGHHGTLFDYETCEPDADNLLVLTDTVLRTLTAALLRELERLFGSPPSLPEDPPPAFLMLAAGFVSVADWMGSDEHVFPHAPHVTARTEAADYLKAMEDDGRARKTLERHGLIGRFEPPDGFQTLFGFTPYDGFQSDALGVPFGEEDGPEIAVVEAPMGLGKTEIALTLTARALRRGTADGLYAALPTQATANALFLRVRDFTMRTKHPDADLALTLAHGARGFFEDYQEIVKQTRTLPFVRRASYEDGATPPSEVVAPAWMQSSKRALLAPVGLGTIDQALLGAMGVKHGFVRLFALARKVVVIDEVHSYDVYMGVLLERLLTWLSALGAKVILLSATLAPGARQCLLDAFGAGAAEPDALPVPDYPLLLHGRPGEVVTACSGTIPSALKHLRKTVHVAPVVPEDDEDATAAGVRWVQETVAKGGCVAWIRNTVREAQAAWQQLRDAGIEVNLLHARFTRTDRNEKEEKLLDTLGSPKRVEEKGAQRPLRRVVVATQVTEQSVDVDFDAMLSDLAPVDLLLQRAGRLWRHSRPVAVRHGHDAPHFGVLMPSDADRATLCFGPSAYVYDAEMLARSAVIVRNRPAWPLPEACRTLVTDLYDGCWDDLRLGCDTTALDEARAKQQATRDRMERHAKKTLVSRPTVPVPFVRQARKDLGDADGFVHLGTRYESYRTAAVVLCRALESGFVGIGCAERLLTVPAEDDVRARLAAEEAIALSTVSFPWSRNLSESTLPAPLNVFAHWWREAHPYDDRCFVVLDAEGTFDLDEAYVCYNADIGLVITRERPAEIPADHPLPEDLDF